MREAGKELHHNFNSVKIAEKLGVDTGNKRVRMVIGDHMKALCKSGEFYRTGPERGPFVLYSYVIPTTRPKPSEPAKRKPVSKPTRKEPRVGDMRQAGTGRNIASGASPFKTPNKDVQALVDACLRIVGMDNIKLTGGGHFRVTNPENGQAITFSKTPSDRRGPIKARADLRRIGLNIAPA